jgi:hypothetical protein
LVELKPGAGAEAVTSKVETYAISLYFVVVASATIGFGDIVPSNTIEREVCCVLMFSGSVMISAMLACIAVAIQVCGESVCLQCADRLGIHRSAASAIAEFVAGARSR